MKPRPNHRPAGTYPNLLCTDALTGGRITLFRNPADKVFGERDAYAVSADWSTPDGISAAYAKAEADARAARRGLWFDPNPIPPEDYRHGRARSPVSPEHGEPRMRSLEVCASPTPARVATTPVGSRVPRGRNATSRIEYRPGNVMPVSSRIAAPVNDTYPDTGYWLSTNSNKRHNRKCENYRKTRGYPCSKSEGAPCGKCGG